MRKLLAALCLFLLWDGSAIAGTPVQLKINGKMNVKIDFAYGNINGVIFWKASEYNQTLADITAVSGGTTTINASLYTPTQFELNLTSCTITPITTIDDWNAAQTQVGLQPYVNELWLYLQVLPLSNQNAKANKAQSNFDYLNSVVKSLP